MCHSTLPLLCAARKAGAGVLVHLYLDSARALAVVCRCVYTVTDRLSVVNSLSFVIRPRSRGTTLSFSLDSILSGVVRLV